MGRTGQGQTLGLGWGAGWQRQAAKHMIQPAPLSQLQNKQSSTQHTSTQSKAPHRTEQLSSARRRAPPPRSAPHPLPAGSTAAPSPQGLPVPTPDPSSLFPLSSQIFPKLESGHFSAPPAVKPSSSSQCTQNKTQTLNLGLEDSLELTLCSSLNLLSAWAFLLFKEHVSRPPLPTPH